MRAVIRRLAGSALLATTILLLLSLALPAHRNRFLSAYELVLGGLAIFVIVGALRARRQPWEAVSPFDRGWEGSAAPEQVAELERLDRVLVMSSTSAFDTHHRLRPLLRGLAAERLQSHHGVDLEREPERAEKLAGAELWELLRPDRELGRRSGPGLPLANTARAVEELEAL